MTLPSRARGKLKKEEAMTRHKPEVDESRRGFLKVAVAGAPLGAALVATGAKAATPEDDAASGSGLRTTPHVAAYLKAARF